MSYSLQVLSSHKGLTVKSNLGPGISILHLGPITSMVDVTPFQNPSLCLTLLWSAVSSRARRGGRRPEGLPAVSASAGRQRAGPAAQTVGLHGPGGRATRLPSAQTGSKPRRTHTLTISYG